MNKGIRTIIKILEHPKHKQITYALIKFKRNSAKPEIIGKCAMGEIGCQLGIKPLELLAMSTSTDSYRLITKRTGVPSYLICGENLPFMSSYFDNSGKKRKRKVQINICDTSVASKNKTEMRMDGGSNLHNYIYHMNDSGFTYKQIVEFLKTTFNDIK